MKTFVAAALCAAMLAFGRPASAGDLDVSPVYVILRPGAATDTVTLENRGETDIRLELTGFGWDETQDGKMTLSPVDALVFYPSLVTIAPKQKRVVRVGLTDVPRDTVEHSYRLFFQELPDVTSGADRAATLSFNMKIGIPIFLEPGGAATPEPDIDDASFAGSQYHFALVNRGNAHLLAQDIVVTAKDANGATVVEHKLDAWYVLARESRAFSFPMTAAECGRIHNVSFVVHAPNRPDLTRALGKPSCG